MVVMNDISVVAENYSDNLSADSNNTRALVVFGTIDYFENHVNLN